MTATVEQLTGHSPAAARNGDHPASPTAAAPARAASGPTTRAGPASSAAISAEDVVRLRGTVAGGAHAGPPRRRAAVARAARPRPFIRALGALTGNQAVQMVKAGLEVDLPVRLAGRRRRATWPARPTPTRACTRPTRCRPSCAGSTTPCCAPTRSTTSDPATIRHRLPGADRRRRRGRLRRPAERLRADEVDDRVRRGRACTGRTSSRRRRSAATSAARCSSRPRQHVRTLNAARLAADICGVPTLVVARTDALAADLLTSDVDEIDQPFLTGERTAEGFYRVRSGIEPVLARAKAYAPYCRPDLGRDRHARTSAWPASSPPSCTRSSPERCWPTTALRRSTGRRRWTIAEIATLPGRARRAGLQVPVHHPGRLPRAEPLDVPPGPGLREDRHDAPTSSCRRPSSPTRPPATPPSSTRPRSAPGTSTRSPPPSTPTAAPSRWPAPPKKSSSTS